MVAIEEDCSLCDVTYPYYSLYRCHRCGRLYCRNCFLYDEKGKVICLRCARRRVFPKAPRSKYTYLSVYLARRAKYGSQVTLPFSKIEEVIGNRLPFSAYHYKHWWGNTRNRSPSEAWLTVGWKVKNVDLERKMVTFTKDKPTVLTGPKKRRRRKPVSEAFKALARKRRPRKPLGPSKTKVARAQARLKNIDRRKSSTKVYNGKFKPKGAYEKRLYRPEEKPE
jgi:hypothetical protein